MALIGQILNWCCDEELISANVIGGMKRLFPDDPESRIGKCNETTIRLAWLELERGTNDARGMLSNLATQIVMLTGVRPNEAAKAHRDDFDFEKLEWRPQSVRTKTRKFRYYVSLTPWTAGILQRAFGMSPDSKWAFANPDDSRQHIEAGTISRHWRRVRDKLLKAGAPVIPDCTLYDASRRKVRTCLEQDLGFPEAVCEAAINHQPGKDIKRRYFVGSLEAEIRKAHEAWQRELLRIIRNEPRPDNVIAIKSGATQT